MTKIIQCKNCKHRPILESEQIVAPMDEDGYRDDTCPYLCEDCYYNRIPKDEWYCNFGELKP